MWNNGLMKVTENLVIKNHVAQEVEKKKKGLSRINKLIHVHINKDPMFEDQGKPIFL